MPALASAGFKVRVTSSPVWRDFPLRLLSLRIDRCFVPINGVVNLSEDDKAVKKLTFATLLPLPVGRYVYFVLTFGAYGTLLLNTLFGALPFLTLVSFSTLPKAYSLSRSLWRASSRINYNVILVGTAKLHMYFGILFVFGIVGDTLLRS